MTTTSPKQPARLAARTAGPVWAATAVDRGDYDRERRGFNMALDLQATGPDEKGTTCPG